MYSQGPIFTIWQMEETVPVTLRIFWYFRFFSGRPFNLKRYTEAAAEVFYSTVFEMQKTQILKVLRFLGS